MMEARSGFLVVMILVAAATRVVPYVLQYFGVDVHAGTGVYPWNFSPVTAMCLFGAAHFSQRRWALLAPLGALLLSDLLIGLLMHDVTFGIYEGMPVVYACFAAMTLAGGVLRKHRTEWAIATAGVLAEVMFFVVTNGAYWASSQTLYTHDLSGLINCYVAALPFFKNSLIGTLAYSAALFGALEFCMRQFPAVRGDVAEAT